MVEQKRQTKEVLLPLGSGGAQLGMDERTIKLSRSDEWIKNREI